MSDSKEFKWDDSLVREFIEFERSRYRISDQDYLGMDIEKFKKSKIPVPEYEILSFKGDVKVFGEDKFFNLIGDGVYLDVKCNMPNSLNSLLNEGFSVKTGQVSIYSVKRLSDGEVFSIREICQSETGYVYCPIKRFFVKDGLMYVQFDEGHVNNDGCLTINSIQKVKPKLPLFTTEDGVEIFKTDLPILFGIRRQSQTLSIEPYLNGTNPNEWHYFTTKEAAEKYQLENKPIQVSYKELTDFKKNVHQFGRNPTLKDFFKSKI